MQSYILTAFGVDQPGLVSTLSGIIQDKGGFIYAHWDGTTETENIIKKETKATIRCIPIDNESSTGKCIVTGKESKGLVVFGKAY